MPFKDKNKEKIYKHEWYLKNKSHLLKINREWRKKNPKKSREFQENYRKNNLLLFAKKASDFRKKYPLQAKAHNIIHNLKISFVPICQFCGTNKNLEMHHPDYSKPFKVMILCRSCHRALHIQLKGGELICQS